MPAAHPLEPLRPPNRLDQRVTLHGIGWHDYEALLAMRGESSATRVTYLEGELELLSPSFDHETRKKTLGLYPGPDPKPSRDPGLGRRGDFDLGWH